MDKQIVAYQYNGILLRKNKRNKLLLEEAEIWMKSLGHYANLSQEQKPYTV